MPPSSLAAELLPAMMVSSSEMPAAHVAEAGRKRSDCRVTKMWMEPQSAPPLWPSGDMHS
eukprot:CAMPEP_0180662506 /NCGR_PEP_ID=MMETSP1037_2-20121125/59432_1 /TAXON_ID=632150 /ORGANISM="Azadinium spinosum, Strain 3D9" /LENGTH=59 /DNA_ID=CAMNT_0022690181 /DNA_START=22 /DNA_END=198 /DNA_ORIENTATION=-